MPFSEELKLKFKDIINQRCGLYFKDYDLKDLVRAVGLRMSAIGIDLPSAYYNFLLFSDQKEDEFRELLNLLTVNHTYFFRNEPQFKALKEKIIPEIIQRKLNQTKDKPTLRIWSAGCSTGEEPYTIAMIVQEAIPDFGQWDIQILATDVSTKSLAEAAQGVYGASSMRLVPIDYRSKYFEVVQADNQKRFKIHDSLKNMVKFGFFNLIDEQYPRDYDIIFCRNVVIYFEAEIIRQVMLKMNESLVSQGYLLIGYSESLQFISDCFRMQDWQEAIYYRKAELKTQPQKQLSGEFEIAKYNEEIARAEVAAELKDILGKNEFAPSKKIQELLVEIIKSMHAKHYENALELVSQAHKIDNLAADPYYLAAEILANQGKISEAKLELKKAFKISPLFAPAYYLFGTFCIEEGQTEEARKFFKKSLYLDGNFVLAHFDLANTYKDEGRHNEAIREYRNSLNVLVKMNPSDIIAYSGGFNAAAVSGICKSNIERLKDF